MASLSLSAFWVKCTSALVKITQMKLLPRIWSILGKIIPMKLVIFVKLFPRRHIFYTFLVECTCLNQLQKSVCYSPKFSDLQKNTAELYGDALVLTAEFIDWLDLFELVYYSWLIKYLTVERCMRYLILWVWLNISQLKDVWDIWF